MLFGFKNSLKKGGSGVAFFFIGMFILFFSFLGVVNAVATPRFEFWLLTEKSFVASDGDVIQGTIRVKNVDGSRTIDLRLGGNFAGDKSAIVYDQSSVTLDPQETQDIDFDLTVPVGTCQDTHAAILLVSLQGYTGSGGTYNSIRNSTAIGRPLTFDIQSGIGCPLPPQRYVFYDADGDYDYEPGILEKPVNMGVASLYDASDTLILSTSLSATSGIYNVPGVAFTGSAQDFYFNIDTSKFVNPDKVDQTWEGNLYVSRIGSYGILKNAYLMSVVASYDDINFNIDIRSRNTDQRGSFSAGTISIGPDDKDEIITPSRWDTLVSGTDYAYVDLDHDGRVDPDDKDHVISPLYWDFPNL